MEKATTRAKAILDAMRKITKDTDSPSGYDSSIGGTEVPYFTLNRELKDIRTALKTNREKAAFVKYVQENGQFKNKNGDRIHESATQAK